MADTLLRVFDSLTVAERAREALIASGISAAAITLDSRNDEAGPVEGNFALDLTDQPTPPKGHPTRAGENSEIRAAVQRSFAARRLEPKRAKFCLRREAAAVIGQHNHQDPARAVGRARPNPSLNHRTPNGRMSWPRLRYAVHFLSPGQAIPPSVSG